MSKIKDRIDRCMSILRQLQRGPVDRDTLMHRVAIDLARDVYEQDKSQKARESQFSKDIAFLRNVFGVHIPNVDRRHNVYEFAGFGEFQPLGLSNEELETLSFLLQTFREGAPRSIEVQRLLNHIVDMLTQNQQADLEHRQVQVQLRLHHQEHEQIHPRVLQKVKQALKQKRELQFAYRTASQNDETPRIHTVQPYAVTFDPARGHLYLDAYWLTSDGPLGKFKQAKWQQFRLDKILDDEHLRILPNKLPPSLPRRPQYHLEYWLSPDIARHGQVTRHFSDMKIHETDRKGWIRVTGTTDNLFRAVRLLLGYGPNCRVTGGSEARREMEKLVQGLAEVYGISLVS
jgi:predicted DNA-binding transcriptional regulator YafY